MSKYTPSFFEQHHLKSLSRSELDEALQNGYFPTGVNMATAIAARYSPEHPVTARLYLRAPVNPPVFSKSKRKLLRRNSQRFQYEVREFYCDNEINNLWIQFKKQAHKWQNVPGLTNHIFRNNSSENFPARLLIVKEGSRLVAFTVMFEGNKTLASLEAAYDLNYSKFSPGIFTMLLELEYGHATGKEFYYPGFIYKDVPMFQYKKRLGGLQFFQLKTREWKPIEELVQDDWVFEVMKSKILNVVVRLSIFSPEKPPVGLVGFIHPDSPEAESGFRGFTPYTSVETLVEKTQLFYHPFSKEYIIIKKVNDAENSIEGKIIAITKTRSEMEAIELLRV